ncbi:MAG: hypothetical protein WD342_05090 [Verrucomicrobiales bacterium]
MRGRAGSRDESGESRRLLWTLGIALAAFAVGLAVVSRGFAYELPLAGRPFLPLALVLAGAFFCWLYAARHFWGKAGRQVRGRDIFWLALLMRLPLLLASQPIQETDYYRYLWDGRAMVENVSPYRHSPADLDDYRAASQTGPETVPPDAAALLAAQDRSPSLETIFERIDHRAVPTIYPPVSQAVFALAARLTPETAPVFVHLAVLRALVVAFDLGTVLLLLAILRHFDLPAGRAVAYAWCPLVLKEFANTSHMDSVAVFFTVAAFLAAAKAWWPGAGSPFWRSPALLLPLSALLLAVAVLSKWYPLAMAPVFVSLAWRRWRWKTMPVAALAAAVIAGGHFASRPSTGGNGSERKTGHDELSGMRAFLGRWEMNDLIFSVVRENLRPVPESGKETRPEPWYAVAPESLRRAWSDSVEWAGRRLGIAGRLPTPDFLGARLFCGGLLAALAAWLALRRWEGGLDAAPAEAGRALFLTMAACWYLSATQNPWYWTWALPFVVFARSRAWLLVPGFALLYYARFWLIYTFPEPFWRGYDGQRFFDHVVVWVEHLPMLLAIGWYALKSKGTGRGIKRPAIASAS